MPTQPDKSNRNVWVLLAFQKAPGELLVDQWVLSSFTEDDFRRLFKVPPKQHVLGSYEVTEAMIPALRRHIDIPIDLGKYDYFIELQAAR